MHDDLIAHAHRVEALTELIREVEWIQQQWRGLSGPRCPVCDRERPHGHAHGCRLARALAPRDAEP